MQASDTPPEPADADADAAAERPARSSSGSRLALSAFFVGAGVNHFINPRLYEAIVPPSLAAQAKLVVEASGVAEVIVGLGVLPRSTRRISGLGVIALLLAVFPANLYMAREPEKFKKIPRWALYARLPLQPLMMVWAWRATRQ